MAHVIIEILNYYSINIPPQIRPTAYRSVDVISPDLKLTTDFFEQTVCGSLRITKLMQ